MILTPREIKAVNRLVKYLNEKFDGHGLVAHVTLTAVKPERAGYEADKGEIVVVEDQQSVTGGDPLLTYGWRDSE